MWVIENLRRDLLASPHYKHVWCGLPHAKTESIDNAWMSHILGRTLSIEWFDLEDFSRVFVLNWESHGQFS